MMPSTEERLVLTGMLGDVMRESAQAAVSYVWSHAESLDIDPKLFESKTIHVHVPAGAIPKDVPSAGVTIMTALASLATRRPVQSEVAMTGEITLRGKVLPVGGIKEKVLAAHRAGIRSGDPAAPERAGPRGGAGGAPPGALLHLRRGCRRGLATCAHTEPQPTCAGRRAEAREPGNGFSPRHPSPRSPETPKRSET